jgi:hypothetical protein
MYDITTWLDHVTDPDNCYLITANGDGTYKIQLAGTVMQQGTNQDASHFNNMERGIWDAHAAFNLLLNALRQQSWEKESGTVTLSNSSNYPFNDSQKTVALQVPKESADYIVLTEVVSFTGNVGDLVISDRLRNGFKIAFTGSASSATINYTVIGGVMQ